MDVCRMDSPDQSGLNTTASRAVNSHQTCRSFTNMKEASWKWAGEVKFQLRKGKAPRKHSLHGKKQPRFYWSCSSTVIKDATPLTPIAHERDSIFKCKQHAIHDPRGPAKYNYTKPVIVHISLANNILHKLVTY